MARKDTDIIITEYFDETQDKDGNWVPSQFEQDNGFEYDPNIDGNWAEIRLRALSEDAPHKWLYVVAGDSEWPCDILYDTIGRQSDLHDKDMEWLWEGDIVESGGKVYEIYRRNEELVAATNGTLRPRDALDYVSLNSLKHPITWLSTVYEHPELLRPSLSKK